MKRATPWLIAALIATNLSLIAIVVRQSAISTSPTLSAGSLSSALDPAATADAALFGASGSDRVTPLVEAARKVSPAVVTVSAVRVVGYDPFYEGFHGDFFAPFMPYRLFENPYRRVPMLGSGFIVSDEGHVLTNHHVIEGAQSIAVTLPDEREFEAELLDFDSYVDIAVLKIRGDELPVADLGSSEDVMIGETVLAIGNPFGQFASDSQPSVSAGVVSARNRFFNPNVSRGATPRVYQDMIQTDAAINPGNSGGPLANLDGDVIGVNTFIISKSGGSQGLGFAIPIDRARAVYDEIREHGKVRTLMLDLGTQTLTPQLARHLGLDDATSGAIVAEVVKGGPAEALGIEVGDVIIRINNKRVRSHDDFYSYFVTLQVGESIELELLHNGEPYVVEYIIKEARPGRR